MKNKQLISFKNSLYAMFFLLIIGPYAAWSQHDRMRTMTLLPDVDAAVYNPSHQSPGNDLQLWGSKERGNIKRDKVVYMHFNLGYIPRGAVVKEVALSLYLKNQVDTTEEQFVQVFELKNQDDWTKRSSWPWENQPKPNASTTGMNAIAAERISVDNMGKGKHFEFDIANPAAWLENQKGNFWLLITANSQQYTYYSTRSGDLSRQPKLLVTYYMPLSTFQYGNWGQYKCDAQHTGQIPWKSSSVSTAFTAAPVFTASPGFIQSDAVYCNNQLVFYYQAVGDVKNIMRSYTEKGTMVAESKTMGGVVSYAPVADRNNNLYCVVAKTTLKMLDLNGLEIKDSKILPDAANVSAVPVVGFDGSLYLSTTSGVYAYSAFPEFKIKWKYTAGSNQFGTVALSEDEKTVYVYDGAGKLVALSNINGTERWSKTGLRAYTTDIPVPAVRDTFVLLTDNSRKGWNFYIIGGKGGQEIKRVTAGSDIISLPVSAKNEAFIINNGKLQTYKLSSGDMTEYPLASNLNPASSLALDNNRTIYILNTQSGDQSLTVISLDKPMLPLTAAFRGSNLTGNFLLLTPGGRLFARNDNYLYAFVPTAFSEKAPPGIPPQGVFSSEYAYRYDGKINVSGTTLTKDNNVIIQSKNGGVGLSRNFKVNQGAQLIIRTEP